MTDTPTPLDHLRRAVEIAGGQTALSKATGGAVAQENISYWLRRMKRKIPGEAALAIERAVGKKVTAAQLRPDLFGRGAR